jgi:uncharacterized membrane protein YheB (UPF0754 family)
MLNPFGKEQDPGLYSYVNLQQRVLQRVQSSKVNDEIFEAVQKAYEDAISKEKTPLARFERQHMFAQILRKVLTDMVKKIDETYKP